MEGFSESNLPQTGNNEDVASRADMELDSSGFLASEVVRNGNIDCTDSRNDGETARAVDPRVDDANLPHIIPIEQSDLRTDDDSPNQSALKDQLGANDLPIGNGILRHHKKRMMTKFWILVVLRH